MTIKIDTNAVQTSADNIKNLNRSIDDDFSIVESAVNKMTSIWKGSASEYAVNAIRHIESEYREKRYSTVNQLVSFLNIQVNSGYETVEHSVVSAADAFK